MLERLEAGRDAESHMRHVVTAAADVDVVGIATVVVVIETETGDDEASFSAGWTATSEHEIADMDVFFV